MRVCHMPDATIEIIVSCVMYIDKNSLFFTEIDSIINAISIK